MRTQRRAWRAGASALAVALSIGLLPLQASALALGRVTVLSALGEPLRAEIELPQITPDEMASLRVGLASPEAYRAAGLNRLPLLQDLQVSLQPGAGGGHVLRLSLDRPVNEPTLDLLLDARWAAGQILRDYTVLLDPPQLRPVSPQAPLAPLPSPSSTVPAPGEGAAGGTSPSAPPAPAASAAAAASDARRRVTVKPGQTAAGIVAAQQVPGVSLDQMLLALLQSNPQAFAGNNMNRLKSGAVLDLPSAEQARAIDPAQARQAVVAQSRDFNEFRQRLAQAIGRTAPAGEEATRQAAGRVEARVEDRAAPPPASDRLTLSKGSVEGRTSATPGSEDRLAAERQAQESAARERELQRNIAELSRLGGLPGAAGSASGTASASAPAAGLAVAAAPQAAAAASSPASSPASAPASAPQRPSPAADTGFDPDDWLQHPLLAWVVGGFSTLLLMAGLFLRQRRQRAEQAQAQAAPSAADAAPATALTLAGAAAPDHDPTYAIRQPQGVPAGLDLDIDSFKMPDPASHPAPVTMPVDEADAFDDEPYAGSSTAPAAAAPPAGLGFPGLSLDLDIPPDALAGAPAMDAPAATDAKALETKLALAEEFRALGDLEGARLLASEVDQQAPLDLAELRERAQRLLSELA